MTRFTLWSGSLLQPMILGDYSLSRLPNKSIIALDRGSVEAEEKTWLSGDIDAPVVVLDFPLFKPVVSYRILQQRSENVASHRNG